MKEEEKNIETEQEQNQTETTDCPETETVGGEEAPQPSETEQLEEAGEQIQRLKDQLLRQMAEFDNFRKRTIKEKTELLLNGGRKVLESLLPVLDDLERAQTNIANSTDVDTLREGVELILSKLMKTLSAQGLRKMETEGVAFDTDFHEAIAQIPAQSEEQKNHVIDCVQAGYLLNDTVIRHAKVVVGQ